MPLLLRRDPILFFHSITLYSDDLHDKGTVEVSVKIRVMPRCFLVLLRRFLRIDGGEASVRDVRYCHVFQWQGPGRPLRGDGSGAGVSAADDAAAAGAAADASETVAAHGSGGGGGVVARFLRAAPIALDGGSGGSADSASGPASGAGLADAAAASAAAHLPFCVMKGVSQCSGATAAIREVRAICQRRRAPLLHRCRRASCRQRAARQRVFTLQLLPYNRFLIPLAPPCPRFPSLQALGLPPILSRAQLLEAAAEATRQEQAAEAAAAAEAGDSVAPAAPAAAPAVDSTAARVSPFAAAASASELTAEDVLSALQDEAAGASPLPPARISEVWIEPIAVAAPSGGSSTDATPTEAAAGAAAGSP